MSVAKKSNVCVVLQQVDRSNWCVVRRELRGGKLSFVSRVATARPYKPACALAMGVAEAESLRIVLGVLGKPPRRFDPKHDMREPHS